MSMNRRAFTLAVALVSATACRLGPQGPSAVAQGQYFSTGNPNYDEFFVRLYRMQVELKTVPDGLAASRAELARNLALEPNTESGAVRKALAAKAGELGGRGVSLAFDRGRDPGGEPRLVVSGTPGDADRPLVKTLEDSVARLAEIRERSSAWQKELDWLPPAGVALDGGVDSVFVGQSHGTRADIHENLADAQKVVALMSSRKKEAGESAADFEALLAGALSPVRSDPPPAPAEEEPKPKPRARATGGGSPRPAAPADETPAPAPKPKQGTAKPDFEP